MDMVEEDEGCANVNQYNGMDDIADGFWLDMEEANDGKGLVVNVMKTKEERLPNCLSDEEEFQAWIDQKDVKEKRRQKQGTMRLSVSQ
jgi:hypothetical protein